jgi:protein TonB
VHDLLDYVEDKPRRGDLSLGVLISIAVHLTVVSFLVAYHLKGPEEQEAALPARFVQLVPQLPQSSQPQQPSITDAPGPRRENPRQDAQLSDADRRASRPNPIEAPRTLTPGDRRPLMPEIPQRGTQSATDGTSLNPEQQRAAAAAAQGGGSPATAAPGSESMPAFRGTEAPQVDWKEAIKDVAAQPSSRRGAPTGDWRAMPGGAGDDLGHAETGPMSFETQWFEWGDYATGMVARIRYHWYSNMPPIIRTGLRGIVTIRFTIQRDGTITDVEIISSSGVPPYDNAAKRAIELASPLAPLPQNFPKASERVTARFFYNSRS